MKQAILIAVITLLLVSLVFFIAPAEQHSDFQQGPWVTVKEKGTVRAFGILLGQDSLQSMVDILGEPEGIAAYIETDKEPSLEAYFGRVKAGDVEGRLVINLSLPNDHHKLIEYSVNVERSRDGRQKLIYDEYSTDFPRQQVITGLSFAPSFRGFTEQLIIQWFGEPQSREKLDKGEYWHYPQKQMDLTWDGQSRIFLEFKGLEVNPNP